MNILDTVAFYYTLTFAISSIIILEAVMLLGIHILPDKRLNSFRRARKYLSLSYFVLGLSGFIGFFTQNEAEDKDILASVTILIASYQALLFTYTILALIQPLRIKSRSILIQLCTITAIGLLLILCLIFHLDSIFNIIFYLSISIYLLQLSYYISLFRINYKRCLESLESYYADDESPRLQWAKFSFYSALSIGILALFSLFFNLYFYMIFSVLYTIYYTYIVCRFYNYQIDFRFAIPVINLKSENGKEAKSEDNSIEQKRKSEQFSKALNKWVEEKKFAEKDVSVDEIAESLGINRSFLQYYFRSYMQTDFRTWRSELRIHEAQSILIKNPAIPLEKLRELVGFNHRANFHQQFQKITGMTPTEFKQRSCK